MIIGKREATAEAIQKGISIILSAPDSRVALGDRKVGFEVADGAVKVQPLTTDSADGRASNRTTVDLLRLMIDSEWKVEQFAERPVGTAAPDARSSKQAAPLPAVSIVYVGPLAALGRIDANVSADALARELSVRRMEHDVAELERLRRLDEERAKAEAQRRKAEEEARIAAAAAAAAAGTIPPIEPPTTVRPALPQGAPPPSPGTAPPSLQPMADSTAVPPGTPAAVDPAATPPADPRKANGVTSEPRQVPSSQRINKGARVQDVFRRQEMGGN